MADLSNYRFTKSHEWVRVEGDQAVIGITDHAQEQLGDVVHVEFPEVGDQATAGETIAEIESVKAVSDIYAPVSGEVVAINEEIDDDTAGVINDDPYQGGWLFRVALSEPGQVEALMDEAAYEAFAESE
jgi:glycine cleavage system H protein